MIQRLFAAISHLLLTLMSVFACVHIASLEQDEAGLTLDELVQRLNRDVDAHQADFANGLSLDQLDKAAESEFLRDEPRFLSYCGEVEVFPGLNVGFDVHSNIMFPGISDSALISSEEEERFFADWHEVAWRVSREYNSLLHHRLFNAKRALDWSIALSDIPHIAGIRADEWEKMHLATRLAIQESVCKCAEAKKQR